MINWHIMMWDIDNITDSISSWDHISFLWVLTDSCLLSVNHCNFSKSEIFCTSWLHFSIEWMTNWSNWTNKKSSFRGADNFSMFFLSCGNHEWSMETCHGISGSNQSQITIIWDVLLILWRAILIISPNINIDISMDAISIQEMNLESSMSHPLKVNLSLKVFFL